MALLLRLSRSGSERARTPASTSQTGHIPSRVTVLLDPSDARIEHAQELVDADLWKATRDGYLFHDWDEYQESSQTVKKTA